VVKSRNLGVILDISFFFTIAPFPANHHALIYFLSRTTTDSPCSFSLWIQQFKSPLLFFLIACNKSLSCQSMPCFFSLFTLEDYSKTWN
jgi:hypothetical protein